MMNFLKSLIFLLTVTALTGTAFSQDEDTPLLIPVDRVEKVIAKIEKGLARVGYESDEIKNHFERAKDIAAWLKINDRPVNVAVLGEGNSGKTTLFNALVGSDLSDLASNDLGEGVFASRIALVKGQDPGDSFYGRIADEGTAKRRVWALFNSPTVVFNHDNSSFGFNVIDSPSYTRNETQMALRESLFMADMGLVYVPEDYKRQDFKKFLALLKDSSVAPVFVFTKSSHSFSKLGAVDFNKIVKELCSEAKIDALGIGVTEVTYSSDDKDKKAESMKVSIVDGKSLVELDSVEDLVKKTAEKAELSISSVREKRRQELKKSLDSSVQELIGFSNFLIAIEDVQTVNEKSLTKGIKANSEVKLVRALEDGFQSTLPALKRWYDKVLKIAGFGDRLVYRGKDIVRGKMISEEKNLAVKKAKEETASDLKVYQNALLEVALRIKKLKESGQFTGPLQNALKQMVDFEYIAKVQATLTTEIDNRDSLNAKIKKDIKEYLSWLKKEKKHIYNQLAASNKREQYVNTALGLGLTVGMGSLIPVLVTNLAKGTALKVLSFGGGVATGIVWGFVLAPKIYVMFKSWNSTKRGSTLLSQMSTDLKNQDRYGTALAKVKNDDGTVEVDEDGNVVLSGDDEDLTDEETDAVSEYIIADIAKEYVQYNIEWFNEFMAKHYFKPLIDSIKGMDLAVNPELVEELKQFAACDQFLSPAEVKAQKELGSSLK